MLKLLLMIQSKIPRGIVSFLTQGHERSVKAKKNIVASVIIRGASIVINLLLVPLTIHYVNATRYGIWLTLSSIIGWMSFFDIGLGNGLRNKFAEAIAQKKNELAKIFVSTTYAIIFIIVCIVFLLFLVINPFLNWAKILNSPSSMAGELSTLALIVFGFFCIQFLLQLIITIIIADQQPAKASLINLLGSTLSLVIIFLLIKVTSGSLIYLGLAMGSAPVTILFLSTLWFYKKDYKKFSPSFRYVNFKYAKDLMSLGVKFFVIQISAILLYQTSNIIIVQLFGPSVVTSYNIAFKYFSVITMIFNIILMPFWSAFTDAWVKREYDWIKNIMKKLLITWGFMFCAVIFLLIISPWVYLLWIGKEVNVTFAISLLVGLWVIINIWNSIFSYFLNGVGKIKLQLYFSVTAAILNIPLAIFLGLYLGLSGVLIANVLIVLFVAWIGPLQYYKIINNKATGIWAQ